MKALEAVPGEVQLLSATVLKAPHRRKGQDEMIELAVHNIKKSFGSFQAVRGVDFELAKGEIVALLGASGCGKTTLLRMIAGLIEPDEGEIALAGRTLFSRPSHLAVPVEDRGIGFVFQSYAIWPHMKVWENVAYGLRVRKVSRSAARKKAVEMLDVVGLADLANRYPGTLSGGQQQRVALARCLVIEPTLLLLDEPLSNLDLRVREQMREYIRELIKRIGVSAVFVTHDYAEALVLADRVLVMEGGVIAEDATPEAIYSRPRTRIAAESVGSSNVLRATTVDASGRASIDGFDTGLQVDRPVAGGTPDAPKTLIIRPEDIDLVRAGESTHRPDDNVLQGTVVGRFYLGANTHYDIETPIGVLRCQTNQHGIDISDAVDVRIAPQSVVMLDA